MIRVIAARDMQKGNMLVPVVVSGKQYLKECGEQVRQSMGDTLNAYPVRTGAESVTTMQSSDPDAKSRGE